MRKAIRTVVGGAALAAALAFFVPSPAQAQVRFYGRFRLPHGSISIGAGDPYYGGFGDYGYGAFPVGSYVPYSHRVIYRPRLGYGFYSPTFACRTHRVYHSHWIPVRRYRTRYVVVQRPVVVERRVYDGRYRGDPYYRPLLRLQPDVLGPELRPALSLTIRTKSAGYSSFPASRLDFRGGFFVPRKFSTEYS